jgi:hypothetical protein
VLPPGFKKIRHFGLYATSYADALEVARCQLSRPTSCATPVSSWCERLLVLTGRRYALPALWRHARAPSSHRTLGPRSASGHAMNRVAPSRTSSLRAAPLCLAPACLHLFVLQPRRIHAPLVTSEPLPPTAMLFRPAPPSTYTTAFVSHSA